MFKAMQMYVDIVITNVLSDANLCRYCNYQSSDHILKKVLHVSVYDKYYILTNIKIHWLTYWQIWSHTEKHKTLTNMITYWKKVLHVSVYDNRTKCSKYNAFDNVCQCVIIFVSVLCFSVCDHVCQYVIMFVSVL
jgi:hypothetical protein